MTDNEIINALIGSILNAKRIDCKVWSLEVYKLENALDLIIRQEAEIERLQKNIDGLNIFTTNHIKVIRLQAIKEFAERLKETITNAINTYYNSNGGGYYLAEDVIEDIDNLVKEMTE